MSLFPQKYDYISSGILKDFHNDGDSNLCKELFRSFGATLFQRVDALPAGIHTVPQGRCRAAEWAPSAWAPGRFLETWEGFVFLRPSPWDHSSLPPPDSGSSRDWWISFGSYSCDVLSLHAPAHICHYTATKIWGFLGLEHWVKWPSWFLFLHFYGSWPPFPEAFVSLGTLGGKIVSNLIYMQFDMCIFK